MEHMPLRSHKQLQEVEEELDHHLERADDIVTSFSHFSQYPLVGNHVLLLRVITVIHMPFIHYQKHCTIYNTVHAVSCQFDIL